MTERDPYCDYCDVCRADMAFEVPPCSDGHGTECPERACTGCGSATLVGPTTELPRAALGRVAGRYCRLRGYRRRAHRPT